MHQYKKYLVKNGDRFDPENFPSVSEEVISIRKHIEHLPSSYKADILVSFLKDHSLQDNWIKNNPGLVELITSGSLFSGSTEALFESCREHPAFRQQLETYLAQSFSEVSTAIQ
jgi:hypothetical protein